MWFHQRCERGWRAAAQFVVLCLTSLSLGACCGSLSVPKIPDYTTSNRRVLAVPWEPYVYTPDERLVLFNSRLQSLPTGELLWSAAYTSPSGPRQYVFRTTAGGAVQRALVSAGLLTRTNYSTKALLTNLRAIDSKGLYEFIQGPGPDLRVWSGGTTSDAAFLSVWSTGLQPRILRTTDGGTSWSQVLSGAAPSPGKYLPAFFTLEANTTLMVAMRSAYGGNGKPPQSQLYSSVDSGTTWGGPYALPITNQLDPWSVSIGTDGGIAGCDYWSTLPRRLIVFNKTGGLYWSSMKDCSFTAFWNQALGVYASQQQVYLTKDRGGSFSSILIVSPPERIAGVRMLGPNEIVVAVWKDPASARILHSVDAGSSWTTIVDLK